MHSTHTASLSLQAVLKSFCEAAKAVSSDRSASSSMQSFYAVLLCELLLATQPVLLPLLYVVYSMSNCVTACTVHRPHNQLQCMTGSGMMIMITITDLILEAGCLVAVTFHAPL